jgi:hypothetical protein
MSNLPVILSEAKDLEMRSSTYFAVFAPQHDARTMHSDV